MVDGIKNGDVEFYLRVKPGGKPEEMGFAPSRVYNPPITKLEYTLNMTLDSILSLSILCGL